jgi:ABC-type multidrug transport system fused ATPase/permease subunit
MFYFFLPNQEKGEKIVMVMRRHWIIMLARVLGWAVVAIMPLGFYLILGEVLAEMFSSYLFGPVVILFTSLYYLYVWLFAFASFVDYYLDVWIVTTHRIVNIEQKGLFARVTSEQKLFRIQDVTSELHGFFSTLFDFGTVYIQTAGKTERFIFKQIASPLSVAKKISRLSEENKKFQQLMMQP